MAQKVIKTIITLRNDTLQAFETVKDTLILRSGEVAVVVDKVNGNSIKIGDGERTFAQLPYIAGPLCTTGGGSGSGVTYTGDGKAITITNGMISLLGLDTATVGQTFRLNADGTAIEWFTPATQADLDTVNTNITSLNTAMADRYTKAEVDEKMTSAFTYTGDVADKATLDTIVSPAVTAGDVKVTENDGKVYAYDGTQWNEVTGTLSLDGYTLKLDFEPVKATVDSLGDKLLTGVAGVTTNENSVLIQLTGLQKNASGIYEVIEQTPITIDSVVASSEDGAGKAGLMTPEDKATLDALAAGVPTGSTVIEGIKDAEGNMLEVTNKIVTLPVALQTRLGLVKGSTATNGVSVNADGTMSVNEISITKIVQFEDDEVIISGGNASGSVV